MSSAVELVKRRELLWNLALREMRGRYKRSVLGWTWSMLNPLSTLLIYYVIFGKFMPQPAVIGDPSGMNNFAMLLLCGLLPWNFFNVSTTVGMGSVVDNGALVKKVAFPREHLVFSVITAGLMTFGIELLVAGAVLQIMGNFWLPFLPLILLACFLLAVFTAGVALLLAAGNVYFRDLKYLWGIALQALFFLTPIVYSADFARQKLHGWKFTIYDNTPMAATVRVFRDLLYHLRVPTAKDLGLMAIFAAIALAVGWWVFGRLEDRFAEEL
ncbi:MAG TPA: ABC transporter permease [Ilumatobacteraceae bacterium]|nr:ABC transporter permease [Ilumatobacteraceae bacterium]